MTKFSQKDSSAEGRTRECAISDRESAMLEHVEFRRKVAEHGLANILSPDALMLSFLALGNKMWREHGTP